MVFIRLLLFSFLPGAILLSCNPRDNQTTRETSSRPNIILILADDQRFNTVHALGNPEIITPNLDNLVLRGTTFTNAYNMGGWNGAICQASRAMLISGRSLWRAHKMDSVFRAGGGIDDTWGKLMVGAGYDTYMTGKWHVEARAEEVFQSTRNVRPGMPHDDWNDPHFNHSDNMPVGYNRPRSPDDRSWSPTDTVFGGFWEGGKHWSEVLRDDAIEFLAAAGKSDSPFFMYLAFNAPHDPRQSPQEFQDLYSLDSIPLPDNWMETNPDQNRIGLGPSLRDEALAPFPRTPYATKVHLKEYYASISHMDTQIGLILEALDKSGKRDNTYLIFTADHGLAIGSHGLMGKQNMYDHSIRAPFIIVGPEIGENKRVDAGIYLQDAMATSLELAGIEKPSYVEFQSILSLARGETTTGSYPAIYGAYINHQRMIRKDDWKLIVYPKASKIMLFNIAVDPGETNDVSDDVAYQWKVKSLFDELMATQHHLQDKLDLSDLYKQTIKR